MSSKFPMVIEVEGVIKVVPDGSQLPVGEPFTVIETDYNPDRIVYGIHKGFNRYDFSKDEYYWRSSITKNGKTITIKTDTSFNTKEEAKEHLYVLLDMLRGNPEAPEILSEEESYIKNGRY